MFIPLHYILHRHPIRKPNYIYVSTIVKAMQDGSNVVGVVYRKREDAVIFPAGNRTQTRVHFSTTLTSNGRTIYPYEIDFIVLINYC